jgi:D-glycero-D-manno-heptose 1,7-bisphosphate phosphatase
MKNKAVFLDRDGVINKIIYDHDRGVYSAKNMDDFEIFEGVEKSIKTLKQKGYLVIIVTNQPGITYGYIDKKEYNQITEFLKKLGVDEVYTCIHPPETKCGCRKPSSKMLIDAANKYSIDLNESYMIGDNISDLQAGVVCGKTIFIGKKRADIMNLFSEYKVNPDGYFESLYEAVKVIK